MLNVNQPASPPVVFAQTSSDLRESTSKINVACSMSINRHARPSHLLKRRPISEKAHQKLTLRSERQSTSTPACCICSNIIRSPRKHIKINVAFSTLINRHACPSYLLKRRPISDKSHQKLTSRAQRQSNGTPARRICSNVVPAPSKNVKN